MQNALGTSENRRVIRRRGFSFAVSIQNWPISRFSTLPFYPPEALSSPSGHTTPPVWPCVS